MKTDADLLLMLRERAKGAPENQPRQSWDEHTSRVWLRTVRSAAEPPEAAVHVPLANGPVCRRFAVVIEQLEQDPALPIRFAQVRE